MGGGGIVLIMWEESDSRYQASGVLYYLLTNEFPHPQTSPKIATS